MANQALPSNCSICLEPVIDPVADNGSRSIAKLHCHHLFHLDCIGSEFNKRGAMQCPNCSQTEDGKWLFARGSGDIVWASLNELLQDDSLVPCNEDFYDDFPLPESIPNGSPHLEQLPGYSNLPAGETSGAVQNQMRPVPAEPDILESDLSSWTSSFGSSPQGYNDLDRVFCDQLAAVDLDEDERHDRHSHGVVDHSSVVDDTDDDPSVELTLTPYTPVPLEDDDPSVELTLMPYTPTRFDPLELTL